MRKPRSRKRVARAGKESKSHSLPLLDSHKNIKLPNHNAYSDSLAQTYAGSVILYEPCLVGSVGCVLTVPGHLDMCVHLHEYIHMCTVHLYRADGLLLPFVRMSLSPDGLSRTGQ